MPTRILARLALAVAALMLLAVPPAMGNGGGGKPSVGFRYGVAAGDVTSTSVILWGRATGSATVRLQVAPNKRFRGRSAKTYKVKSRKSNDYTVQRKVRKLKSGTRYWFRFSSGRRRSALGTFKTAPKRGASERIRFGYIADYDAQPAPGRRRPYWNNFDAFRHLRAERNLFNVGLGDIIYSDTEVPGVTNRDAVTVPRKWGKYKLNLRQRKLSSLRGSAGFYSHWDDHEFYNNFARGQNRFSTTVVGKQRGVSINGETLYRRGVRAFRDYNPVTYSGRNGIYRSVRWGRNLELFFLDERSFRSNLASYGSECNNPQTGDSDLAPTLPQSYRDLFALVASPLSSPVPQACTDLINEPNRTLLGARQYQRFTRAIRRSSARFKVIMNELPIQQFYADPYDRWEGYAAERRRLLTFLRDNVKNVVFLSADVHASLVNDARLQTLESGGPQNTGILDITAAPAATATITKEFDPVLGTGSTQLVDQVFFEPQPPTGLGMRCSVRDKFAFGEVSVTSTRLTVRHKGLDGKPLTDDEGRPCGPFVIPYVP
jgi:alkaline phosphatase D